MSRDGNRGGEFERSRIGRFPIMKIDSACRGENFHGYVST